MTPVAVSAVTPATWSETLRGAPILDRKLATSVPVHIRRWRGIPPAIDQSALDQHFVSVHLGGAKRLYRQGEGTRQTRDVPANAYSVIPAGAAFHWMTEGPVDFMHLYFEPQAIDHVIADAFDRDPRAVAVRDTLGASDALIASLSLALLSELSNDDDAVPGYLDELIHLLVHQTLRLHSSARETEVRARHTLAPYKLRRAMDFIEDNLDKPIGVTEIATAVGTSMFHFSRSFRQSTGIAPYAYLLQRRVEAAKRILIQPNLSLTDAAGQCGFTSLSQFSRMFKRSTGVSPRGFRERY